MTTLRFDLRRPCSNCPFRHDVEPYIRVERFRSIVADLRMDKTFSCHKTTGESRPQPRRSGGRFAKRVEQHCAGALIFMRNLGHVPAMAQVAERLGWCGFKVEALRGPVFSDMGAAEEKFHPPHPEAIAT